MTNKCHGCLSLVEPIDGRCPRCGSNIYYNSRSALLVKKIKDYLKKHAPKTPGLWK